MSKLGAGGLLGDPPSMNLQRAQDEETPDGSVTRSSRSALGAVAPNSLTGSGGLVGKPATPHEPGSFSNTIKSKQQLL